MSQNKEQNRRIVLAKRPHGTPVAENFRLENNPVPEPAEGQVLLRTEYLSLDPYMRGRMSDAPSYAEPVKIDEVMVGATVCQVEATRHPDFKKGEWVLAYSGWQDYVLSDGSDLTRLGGKPYKPLLCIGDIRHAGLYWLHGVTGYWSTQTGRNIGRRCCHRAGWCDCRTNR